MPGMLENDRELALAFAKRKARAKNYSYVLLRVRPRSESEIRERLRLKAFGSEVIESVIADLKKAGLLDDKKFAKLLVDSRMHMKPVGDVLLKYELKRKGVDQSTIDAALDDKEREYDEYAIALPLAKERFLRFKKLDRRKATKRVYDFLARRGFKYDTVRRIIEEIDKGETVIDG